MLETLEKIIVNISEFIIGALFTIMIFFGILWVMAFLIKIMLFFLSTM